MHKTEITPDFEIKNRFIYDWVSFTSKMHSVTELIDLLGMQSCPFETVSGSKGFRWREYFNGVSIHFNEEQLNNSGDFIWLEMSGQGCRCFESYGTGDYESLFKLARDDPTNIHLTRLDIAFDDLTGIFNIQQVCDYTRLEYFTSRMQKYQSIYSNGGNSVLFGSRMSKVLIRIYDKAKERGYDSDKFHWVRCELQLKDVNAMGFVDKLTYMDLREAYLGVLKNYLSFKEPTNDSNKRRWPETEWWSAFLDDAVRISVWSKPGVDYNLSRLERYVLTQPIGSIKTLIELFGSEAFLEMVRKAPAPKNPKYKTLIAQTFEATKLMSGKASLDKLVELTSDNELEFLAEIQDGYREVKRYVDIKRLEQQRIAKMQDMNERREKLFARIRRELEIDKQCKGEKENE